MKIERLIFLFGYPIAARDRKRFGVELLRENGFLVEAWEAASHLGRHPSASGDCVFAERREFASRTDLLRAIRCLGPSDFVIAVMYYNVVTRPVFAALSQATIQYAMINLHALPVSAKARRSGWRDLSPGALVRRVADKVFLPLLPVQPPRFMIGAAEASTLVRPGKAGTTERIWTHALDYDAYLSLGATMPIANPKRAVFLDESLPFHPDFELHKMHPPVTAANYFPAMREALAVVERQGWETIIAVHPSAPTDYERAGYFATREMRRGQTARLVASAGLVISHCSTAIDFAVLLRKPIVFVVTEEMRNTLASELTETMAALLQQPIILPGKGTPELAHSSLRVSEKAYANYERLYIKKPGTPELPLWQIVADRLRAGIMPGIPSVGPKEIPIHVIRNS